MSAANAKACTQNAQYGNGGLWRGMTAPFVNMSLTGSVTTCPRHIPSFFFGSNEYGEGWGGGWGEGGGGSHQCTLLNNLRHLC